jgi:hypothetical protein
VAPDDARVNGAGLESIGSAASGAAAIGTTHTPSALVRWAEGGDCGAGAGTTGELPRTRGKVNVVTVKVVASVGLGETAPDGGWETRAAAVDGGDRAPARSASLRVYGAARPGLGRTASVRAATVVAGPAEGAGV